MDSLPSEFVSSDEASKAMTFANGHVADDEVEWTDYIRSNCWTSF